MGTVIRIRAKFVVAVAIKGRTVAAIERDIVDGIVAANDLDHDARAFMAWFRATKPDSVIISGSWFTQVIT